MRMATRAQARGKQDADVTVYENAVVAAAQGLAAMNSEIDAQYDKEYALIQLIEDSAERQAAMDALNARYNENRRAAAQEYAALLADIVMPVWEQENIQQAAADVDTLTQKLREYSAANETEKPALLEDLNAITAAMDEGAMTEYIAILTQIQSLLDSGMSEAEVQAMFPEIDFSTALEQIASIQAFLNNSEVELKIHSPSRVFEDEVGVMTMRGLSKGVLKESKAQAKIIRNASRFLTGEAREGTIVAGNTTNTHTYHQDSSVNFTGSTFYIRYEKDVQALAVEIAALTRRRQHGRGLRMA